MLSTSNKVIKNTSIMLVGNLFFRLISLIVVVYLAKYLQVEDFGRYNFVFAYLGFFAIITDLGLSTILVREMARKEDEIPKIIGNAHLIKLILSTIAILGAITIISLSDYSEITTKYVYIASVMLLFQSFSDTYKSTFQATLKMKYDVIAKLSLRIVSAIFILIIIYLHGSLYQIILVLTFTELIKTLLSYAFSKNYYKAKFELDFQLWKKLFKESLPVALSSVFLIIYSRIDVLMLSIMKNDIAIGLYSAAYNLSDPLVLIPHAIIASLFPLMSKSSKSSTNMVKKYYDMGFKYIIILMLPVAVGTTLISEKIILLIYDYSYIGSSIALQILIWSLFISSINYLFTSVLVSVDKERLVTLSMGIGVLANIVMNYMLIPSYSYIGASAATLATSVLLFIMNWYLISRNNISTQLNIVLIKPLAVCLIMGIPVYYFEKFTTMNIFLIIILASIIYFVGLVGTKIISNEEKLMFRKYFKL
ncbi:MAG: Membrane protein involved in the export of O-antigen, teichoic acid lipoteichoic acid [Clostridia bacterium]|jgi:O-antigen/teichoic acid export membrane protein|nr:Membrane protein involved in the export of O-antigen, teichoic acid lipoteichoic acid [Clostridia bacterium]